MVSSLGSKTTPTLKKREARKQKLERNEKLGAGPSTGSAADTKISEDSSLMVVKDSDSTTGLEFDSGSRTSGGRHRTQSLTPLPRV